jgi:hypothetical protein
MPLLGDVRLTKWGAIVLYVALCIDVDIHQAALNTFLLTSQCTWVLGDAPSTAVPLGASADTVTQPGSRCCDALNAVVLRYNGSELLADE